jgi:hypothetical protein
MSSRPFHLKKILGDNHIISYNQSNYGMNGIMFGQLGSIIFGGERMDMEEITSGHPQMGRMGGRVFSKAGNLISIAIYS